MSDPTQLCGYSELLSKHVLASAHVSLAHSLSTVHLSNCVHSLELQLLVPQVFSEQTFSVAGHFVVFVLHMFFPLHMFPSLHLFIPEQVLLC